MKIGRITLSDRASAGVYKDRSGPEIERVLGALLPMEKEFVTRLLPDRLEEIRAALLELVDDLDCALVFTTGGTGPSARDVTPEATFAVIGKELPGFGEVMRATSFPMVPTAILSRATAGIRRNSLIVNLPGNPAAIEVCLRPLIPAILEALRHLGRLPENPK